MRISDWSSDVCSSDLFRGDGIALAIACPGDRLPVAGIFHSLIHAAGVGTVHAAADLAADDESDDGAGRNGCQAASAVADRPEARRGGAVCDSLGSSRGSRYPFKKKNCHYV